MRRTGIAFLAVVVLLIGGCTGSPQNDIDHDGPQPAEPQPRAALDAFAAAGLRAERIVPAVGPGRERGGYFETRDDSTRIVAAGRSLVALSIDGDGDVYRVVSSADLGKTWRYVDLPEVTSSIVRLILAEVGPLVVAVGGTDNDSAWVTADGTGWRGGPVPTQPGGALFDGAAQQPDGRIVVGTQGPDENRLVVTADAGVTWQTVDCPASYRPATAPMRCEVPRQAGANLWIRGAEVSLDAGQTWRPVALLPAEAAGTAAGAAAGAEAGNAAGNAAGTATGAAVKVTNAVALPGGGWLGTVVTMPGPTTVAERLAVSTDGRTWEIRPSPCGAAEGSTVSRPRAIGDRWLVSHTCLDPEDEPLRSTLHLVDADGRGARTLAAIDRPDAWFGAPVAVGDAVVVPEFTGGGPGRGALALLHLRIA